MVKALIAYQAGRRKFGTARRAAVRFPAGKACLGARLGPNRCMRELLRTNDVVLLSAVVALLDSARIGHLVLDQHMSVLEGSIGLLPRRLLVEDDMETRARRLLDEAGFGAALIAE